MIVVISDETVEAFRKAAERADQAGTTEELADRLARAVDIAWSVFDAKEEPEVIRCARGCDHGGSCTREYGHPDEHAISDRDGVAYCTWWD